MAFTQHYKVNFGPQKCLTFTVLNQSFFILSFISVYTYIYTRLVCIIISFYHLVCIYVISLLYESNGGGWSYPLPNAINMSVDPVLMKLLILISLPAGNNWTLLINLLIIIIIIIIIRILFCIVSHVVAKKKKIKRN